MEPRRRLPPRVRRALMALVPLAVLLISATGRPVQLAQVSPLPAQPVSAAVVDGAPATPGSPTLDPSAVYIPQVDDPNQEIPVLLALHGMGGSGPRIAERLQNCAATNGWALVAPTFAYRDYMDPAQVLEDDKENLPHLKDLLDALDEQVQPVKLSHQVFVYGFSRGGQEAHRFALFYPDEVAAVAVLSAGSYTLPMARTKVGNTSQTLNFPYGVADLQQYAGHPLDEPALENIPFWIGVGASDVDASQVPRAWDPLIGKTRVDRANRFAETLRQMGADVTLNVFPGTGHDETALMRARACEFFASQTPVHQR